MKKDKGASWPLIAAVGAGATLAARQFLRKQRQISFRERVVLITGGSRGLGLVLARELGAEGARLALCARDGEDLERAQRDLAGRDIEAHIFPCDVRDEDAVRRMVESVEDRLGGVEVLINNAGIITAGPMELMTREDYEEAMDTHFWAAYNTIQAVLPSMRSRRSGRIVNVASVGGKISVPHLLPYCVSKFALVGYSEGLRSELKKDGILVTTVCPGLMQTGSHLHAHFKGHNRTEYTLFSLMAAMPLVSSNAVASARRIVRACRYGDADCTFSLQTNIAVQLHNLFPNLNAEITGAVASALPGVGGTGRKKVEGQASQTALSPSLLTGNIEKAAARNLEK